MDKPELTEGILQVTGSRNRAEKAVSFARRILTQPAVLISYLKNQLGADIYTRLPVAERKAVIRCLVSCAFPVCYYLITIIGKVLKVQSEVSRAFINRNMAAFYGSNRTLFLAIDALIPMLLELDLLCRVKTGLYTKSRQVQLMHPAVAELFIYTDILLSGSRSLSVDAVTYRPWYFFKEITFHKDICSTLIKMTTAAAGGQYIALR